MEYSQRINLASMADRIRTQSAALRHRVRQPFNPRHRANKPNSVLPTCVGTAIIHLGDLSPGRSCTLPAARTRRAVSRCLFGLAGGGVCRAAAVTRDAVRSYRTFSPLPLTRRAGLRPSCKATLSRSETRRVKGGVFSVALSLGSRRVAVSNHRALPSSDFPPDRCRNTDRAIASPTDGD